MRRHLPAPEQFLGQPIPGHPEYVIAKKLDSGCNGHVFVARSNTLGREIACKVIPAANLIGADRDPPTWKEEILKANRVPSNRVVKFYSTGVWPTKDGDCVFLLSDLVRGQALRRYQEISSVSLLFVLDFLKEMLDFLRELQEVGLEHGDCHSGLDTHCGTAHTPRAFAFGQVWLYRSRSRPRRRGRPRGSEIRPWIACSFVIPVLVSEFLDKAEVGWTGFA